jgi:hypothetical protein
VFKRFLCASAIAVILLLVVASSVLAIAQPDTTPQILSVFAYHHLLETDDQGYLIDIYTDYSALPSETITDSYMVSILDIDGTTVLRTVAPYTFIASGYGRELVWIYFSAADAPTYNQAYTIRLEGNPLLTWTPVATPPSVSSGVDYWSSSTSITSTQAELASEILYLGDRLELAWSLDIVEELSTGIYITATGASYFMNVMPNVRTMAPSVFSSGEITPDHESTDYSTADADDLSGLIGSPLDLTDAATSLGTTRGVLTTTGTLIVIGILIFYAVRAVGGKIALPLAGGCLILASAMNMVPRALGVGMGVFCIILTGFLLFYKPSSA